MPLYFVGLMGMPRRSFSWEDPSFHPYMITAVIGALGNHLAATVLGPRSSFGSASADRDQSRVPRLATLGMVARWSGLFHRAAAAL